MAQKEKFDKISYAITLSRREAVEIIALLSGHLGNVAVPGNHGGAAPSIHIIDKGVCVEKLVLIVDTKI